MRRRDEFYDTLNSTASYGGHSYGGQENNYYDGSYDPSIGTRRSLQAAVSEAAWGHRGGVKEGVVWCREGG